MIQTYKIEQSFFEDVDKKVSVLILGAGGTGSELIDQLFRMDVSLQLLGRPGLDITLADGDTVSQFNIGRQRFYPFDIGLNKAEVLASRYELWWGAFSIQSISEYVTPEEVCEMGPDIIITCLDSAKWRWEFHQYLGSLNVQPQKTNPQSMLWLDCGNDKNTGQVILGHAMANRSASVALPTVCDLYPSMAEVEDDEEDSCSSEDAFNKQDFGINIEIALQATGLVWQLLRYGSLEVHGAYIDRQNFSVQPLPIDTEQWRLLGYAPPV
jgi:PRTRC genetic system ThiF family protein